VKDLAEEIRTSSILHPFGGTDTGKNLEVDRSLLKKVLNAKDEWVMPFALGVPCQQLSFDIFEDDKGIHLKGDIPGAEKKNVKLFLDGDFLIVQAERALESEADKYLRKERAFGRAKRTFCLPDYVNKDGIKSTYENGVLCILLPVIPAKRHEKTRIEVGHSQVPSLGKEVPTS